MMDGGGRPEYHFYFAGARNDDSIEYATRPKSAIGFNVSKISNFKKQHFKRGAILPY